MGSLQILTILTVLQILQILLLHVSAQVFHRDLAIIGCSDSEKESMYGLDGDVLYYADFVQQKEVYTLPTFGDPIECEGCYDGAVTNLETCKANLQTLKKAMKDLPLRLVPPGAPLVYPRDHLKPSEENTLVCHASGFYPAPVKFYWTKDRVNVSSTSVTQAYPQSDGTFSQFSTLRVLRPEEGQVYSCSLEHPALKDRVSRLWMVEFQKASLAPSVFCGVGLSLGLVGVAVGTFFLVKGNECR